MCHPKVVKTNSDAQSQTDPDHYLNAQETIEKLTQKVQRLEQQLLAENEANDDLTEQLDQAYKAGYKTRQENIAHIESNKLLKD